MDWSAKSVLITGGSGSLGKALVARLLAREKPRRVIVFSRDEGKHLIMRQTITDPESRLRFFIGDVRDRDRIRRALHGVNVVIHAAAIKEIGSCEQNVIEAVRTNIDGAVNVVEACIDAEVDRAILVSTDKSCASATAYGSTKAVAERIFIHGNSYSGSDGPAFSAVRYGNVLASRGSVIELWRDQISRGNLIEITSPHASRFWITMLQAVEFVISSVERMQGGEVFIPILPSATIATLAKALHPEAGQQIIGLRSSEKVHEVLVSAEEARSVRREDGRYVLRFGTDYPPSDPNRLPGEYGSASPNVRKLTIEDLRDLIGEP